MRRNFKYIVAFIIGLIPIVLMLVISSGDPRVGMNLSDITFIGKDQEEVTLGKYRGVVTVINVWATWCTPCVKELPSLLTLQEEFQVVLINTDGDVEAGNAYLRKGGGMVFTASLWDKNGQKTRKELSVTSIPQTFIVDEDMVIREVVMGDANWQNATLLNRIRSYVH